jgi:enterochelin esterase-like enzyme
VSNEGKLHLTRRALLAAAPVVASAIVAAIGGKSAILAARQSGTSPMSTTTDLSAPDPHADAILHVLDPPSPASDAQSLFAAANGTAGAASPPSTPVPSPMPSAPPAATTTAAPVMPSGSQVLDRTFTSAALGREMPYFVYLPVGYAESGKSYPTLYMLHGHGGSNTEWIGYGLLETADKIINAGQIPPMIIVLPQGDQAFWVNHADDGQRWGDYTAQDVVQHIDATYRTIPDTNHRGIGGLSMGADGAMQLAINYPGTFGTVGVHSPTLRDYPDTAAYVSFFGDEAYFNAHDPVHLAQQYPDRARALQLWLDVGAGDTDWHESVVSYHNLLTQLSVPHTFHGDWPGIHDGYYWGGHAADYVHFYGAALADT